MSDAWTPPAAADDSPVLVKALGDMCKAYLGENVVVALGWQNRVSRPSSRAWVQITPLAATRHGTNVHEYPGPEPVPGTTVQAGALRMRSLRSRTVQLDFFGDAAATWAHVIVTALTDELGCDFLQPYGVAPLDADDPLDLTAGEGDERAFIRWMIRARFQCVNAPVSLPVDWFSGVNLHLKPQA